MVVVTVKSADTAGIADIIASHAPTDAVIVSLQNGVGNAAVLRERLPGRRVLAGMVPFNVIARGEAGFHRATSGDIVLERDQAGTAARLAVPGLPVRATGNITGVQWGKLLVNLNNALNALADLPLRQQLAQRSLAQAAGRPDGGRARGNQGGGHPAGVTDADTRRLDAAFAAAARRRVRMGAGADHEDRSRGALVDVGRPAARPPHRNRLSAGRDHRIAERHGLDVPLSRRIVALIRQAEAEGAGSPGLTPEQIRP